MSSFDAPLSAALREALAFFEESDTRPVGATADLATLRAQLGKPLGDGGLGAEEVIAELARDTRGGLLGSSSGRFFGWVIGGSLPAALAADWLASAWDQNAALYACSPAAGVVEEIAGAWLKELLGLPPRASFAFVTGTQLAHVTCLATARHALLARAGWDVEKDGLYGAPPIPLLSGNHGHGSLERAVRLLGLGSSRLVDLPIDDSGRLAPAVLEEALAAGSGPAIVVLQAGDINTGAFDPFEELVPLAHRHGAWVHVDGAFGLWAAASPEYRHLTRGAEGADSWAVDGHKWLNVPYDCGYAFVAHPDEHRAAMSHRAPYLVHDDTARDEIDWNPDWSRRARGFATYAALRQLGRRGVAELIERCCLRTRQLVDGMRRSPAIEILSEPILNQALVAFGEGRTEEVIARIVAGGEAFFGATSWRGRRAMRISVCNWQTSEEDVQRVVRAVIGAASA